jgi:hypothetical protein
MAQRRITPEEAMEAYRVTGLVPARDTWADLLDDGKLCGCLQTAFYLQAFPDAPRKCVKLNHDVSYWFEANYGTEYSGGIIGGFDGYGPRDESCSAEHKLGYVDGLAAWSAVAAALLSAEPTP